MKETKYPYIDDSYTTHGLDDPKIIENEKKEKKPIVYEDLEDKP